MMKRFRRRSVDVEAGARTPSTSTASAPSTSPPQPTTSTSTSTSTTTNNSNINPNRRTYLPPSADDPLLDASLTTSSTIATTATTTTTTSQPPPSKKGSSATPWWWLWKEVILSFLLAIIFCNTIKGGGHFKRLEDNGFALVATTAPGSHWGNWRSLTRCDCKAFHQCYSALSKAKTLSSSRVGQFIQLATCQLATGQDDDCQLGDKEIKKGLTRFRFFWPELLLRLKLAADFRLWVRLGVYWLMSCALLEIIFFLFETTRLRWQHKGKQETNQQWWEKEICVWLFLITWHEALSYIVHYFYYDSHTLCDGTGLFFRDAMALFTLIQIGQRAVLGGAGPSAHRAWLLNAEAKFISLQGRPWWVQVVRDPRIGAFHVFSGLDLKVVEDPVGVFTRLINTIGWVYEKGMALLAPRVVVVEGGGRGSGKED